MHIAAPIIRSPSRKSLHHAIAACFAAAACSAHAVYLAPDGVGQALIYPYYTVQSASGNAFNTYLSVVNTTSRAKAVKVRFREGRNAREVLDFNLYLSPNDVWTASLGPQDPTTSSPAVLVTADKSCTSPPVPAAGLAFRNSQYVGSQADAGPTTLDRTREGYFEVIEMATLSTFSPNAAAAAVTHTSAGAPSNCAYVQPENGFRAGTDIVNSQLRPPNGGLMGTFTLINVANGLNFAGNATALAELFAAPSFGDAGDAAPNLGSADAFAATVAPNSPSGSIVGYRAIYANGRDAVSATLMKSSLTNEFVLDTLTRSSTDVVMTFPTKSFYVAAGGGTTVAPFTATSGAGGACEPVDVQFFDRGSQGAALFGSQFEGLPPDVFTACWSAQVLALVPNATTLVGSTVLGALNYRSYTVNGYRNGWTTHKFKGTNAVSVGLSSRAASGTAIDMATGRSLTGATLVHKGLPVIGFAVSTLNNGLLNCTTFGGSAGTCVGSYGLLTEHRYDVNTSPTP